MGPSADAGRTGVVPLYVDTGVELSRRSGVSVGPFQEEVLLLSWAWDWEWL
jgi:hypothetical protein